MMPRTVSGSLGRGDSKELVLVPIAFDGDGSGSPTLAGSREPFPTSIAFGRLDQESLIRGGSMGLPQGVGQCECLVVPVVETELE